MTWLKRIMWSQTWPTQKGFYWWRPYPYDPTKHPTALVYVEGDKAKHTSGAVAFYKATVDVGEFYGPVHVGG